jgi:carbamate kinase
MPETLVIALGGNAITRSGEPGTIPQQFEHTTEILEHLKPPFQSDCRFMITHGSGPQIGNTLIRVEEGERRVPMLPLDSCNADCQGGMGYMGPKIEAPIDFIEHGGEECIITSTEQVANAVRGEGGTHIVAPRGRANLEFSP